MKVLYGGVKNHWGKITQKVLNCSFKIQKRDI